MAPFWGVWMKFNGLRRNCRFEKRRRMGSQLTVLPQLCHDMWRDQSAALKVVQASFSRVSRVLHTKSLTDPTDRNEVGKRAISKWANLKCPQQQQPPPISGVYTGDHRMQTARLKSITSMPNVTFEMFQKKRTRSHCTALLGQCKQSTIQAQHTIALELSSWKIELLSTNCRSCSLRISRF